MAAPYGVNVDVDYARGVPPVVNDVAGVDLLRQAAAAMLGADNVHEAEQSLGGEDFASFLEVIPGALARLGVRSPGAQVVRDLHRGDFDADEGAIPTGIRLLTATAMLALS